MKYPVRQFPGNLTLVGLLSFLATAAMTTQGASSPASNLKLSVSGNTAVLRWTGTPGVLYQAEGRTSLGASWQGVGLPTTHFAVTNILNFPMMFYRVGIFTNTTTYTANTARKAGDTNTPTVPTWLAG